MLDLPPVVPVAVGAAVLAYANGANDNFKGVATLYGSGVLSFRAALATATAATWLGSVSALLLAGQLLRAFSGKGLVDAAILAQGTFAVSVAVGAALTVLLATRLGLPISTTHALVGGLVGGGLATGSLQAGRLASVFLLPLAVSPLLAAGLAGSGYLLLRGMRRALGLAEDDCLCVEPAPAAVIPGAALGMTSALATVRAGRAASCRVGGRPLPGLTSLRALDLGHLASGVLVSFARGLNDTPKIAGILLIGAVLAGPVQGGAVVAVATVMAVGGLLSSRRVARVMSLEITELNEGQGFAANVVTSLLVLGASKVGVPVSTTHVACGALFGIGVAGGGGDGRTIGRILAAWVVTLPAAAALTAIVYRVAVSFS